MSAVSAKTRESSQTARTEPPEPEKQSAPGRGVQNVVMSLQRDAGNRAVSSLVGGNSGRPLDPGTQAEMEGKFGADFADVRIHHDRAATDIALNAGARAITTGHDIAFGPGYYDPASGTGKRLLAHELAHVVQQNRHSGRNVSGPAAESEARQAGADVTAGRAASVQTAAPAGPQADRMTKEEVLKQIADLEAKAAGATGKEADGLFKQRDALMRQLQEAESTPVKPPAPATPVEDVSVRKTALEIGAFELDRPRSPVFGFGSKAKPSTPRDLTVVRLIVKQGTPMRKSVAMSHWPSRAAVEQFMNDYITVADEDPATKPQADQARRDRKLILQELDTAEEDVLAGRLKMAEGEQHIQDVKKMLQVPVPEGIKPTVAVGEVLGLPIAKTTDALLDFVPYVGVVKMALEAATGKTISGQLDKYIYAPSEVGTPDLDTVDRIMRLLPLAVAGASKIASHAPGWTEALARLRKGTSLGEKALGEAVADTAKLAGREKEVARALIALRARKEAEAAVDLETKLKRFAKEKPANDVLPPPAPKTNVIPLRPAVEEVGSLPLAAGHDVEAPGGDRPVASAGGGAKVSKKGPAAAPAAGKKGPGATTSGKAAPPPINPVWVARRKGPWLDLQSMFSGSKVKYVGTKAFIEEVELDGVHFDRIEKNVIGEVKGDYGAVIRMGSQKAADKLLAEAASQMKVAQKYGLHLEWWVRQEDLIGFKNVVGAKFPAIRFVPY